jgi:hypothetical protein
MVILTAVETKLLRLLLDPEAHSGEAEASRRKLITSLAKRGKSAHDLVELIQSASEQISEDGLPPKMSRSDYGLCRMPFGKTKGQLFMDLSPSDLRSARRWAMRTPELAQKFRQFIHDVDAFLSQSA